MNFVAGEADESSESQLKNLGFIGRDNELQILHETFRDISNNLAVIANGPKEEEKEAKWIETDGAIGESLRSSPPIVLIHGQIGTGKTALVSKFLKDLELKQIDEQSGEDGSSSHGTNRHLCLVGKHYESENSSPFCAITTAVNSLVFSLSKSDSKALLESVQRSLSSVELDVLMAFFPDLTSFFTPPDDSPFGEESESSRRNSITPGVDRRSMFVKQQKFNQQVSSRSLPSISRLQEVLYSSRSLTNLSNDRSTDSIECSAGYIVQGHVWDRLKYTIFSFMKLIMAMNRPVIMFIDDLQWADHESVNFMKTLLADKSLTNLMFIGTWCEDKGGNVGTTIKNMLAERDTKHIHFTNYTKEDTSKFLSESLHLNNEATKIVSELVYNRTKGNIFLIIQCLEEEVKKKSLVFSESTNSWYLNLENNSEHLSETAMISVENKIRSCSKKLQKALIIASYMGYDFDKAILFVTLEEVGYCKTAASLSKILADAVMQGLLTKNMSSYCFAHNKVFEACSSLLEDESDVIYIRGKIGMFLYKRYSSKVGEDWMLPVAANHINFSDPLEIEFLDKAQMNLKAGKMAMSMAAYEKAESFLMHGMTAVNEIRNHWTNEYELTMSLASSLVDVKFCLDIEYEGQEYADEILKRAKCAHDKVPTYLSSTVYYIMKDNHSKALETVLNATKDLKLFPKRNHPFHFLFSVLYMKHWYKFHSDDCVLKLPILQKESEHQLIKLFLEGFRVAAFVGRSTEAIIFAVRGLRLSLRYGLCGETAIFLLTIANTVILKLHDNDLGMRFVNLSLRVNKLLPINEVACWSYYAYSHFFPWSMRIDNLLRLYQEGYRCAMEIGIFNAAAINRHTLNGSAFAAGYPLGAVVKSFDDTFNHFGIYGVQFCALQMDEYRRALYVLTGKQDMNKTYLNALSAQNDIDCDNQRLVTAYLMGLILCVLFRDYETADKMAEKGEVIAQEALIYKVHFMEVLRLCFKFLVKAGLAYKTGKKEDKETAIQTAKKVKGFFALRTSGNSCLHIELLIDAEVIALDELQVENIAIAHKKAARIALEGGFTQFAAMALELAGEHFVRLGDPKRAGQYFSQARDCYQEWGAIGKVRHLEASHSAHFRQPFTNPVITELEKYFEVNQKCRCIEALSLDYQMPEDDKVQLLGELELDSQHSSTNMCWRSKVIFLLVSVIVLLFSSGIQMQMSNEL